MSWHRKLWAPLLSLLASFAVAVAPAVPARAADVQWPDTEMGEHARAWFEMLKSDDAGARGDRRSHGHRERRQQREQRDPEITVPRHAGSLFEEVNDSLTGAGYVPCRLPPSAPGWNPGDGRVPPRPARDAGAN